jgi:hypothetical protein
MQSYAKRIALHQLMLRTQVFTKKISVQRAQAQLILRKKPHNN